jgi:hypothetical protein
VTAAGGMYDPNSGEYVYPIDSGRAFGGLGDAFPPAGTFANTGFGPTQFGVSGPTAMPEFTYDPVTGTYIDNYDPAAVTAAGGMYDPNSGEYVYPTAMPEFTYDSLTGTYIDNYDPEAAATAAAVAAATAAGEVYDPALAITGYIDPASYGGYAYNNPVAGYDPAYVGPVDGYIDPAAGGEYFYVDPAAAGGDYFYVDPVAGIYDFYVAPAGVVEYAAVEYYVAPVAGEEEYVYVDTFYNTLDDVVVVADPVAAAEAVAVIATTNVTIPGNGPDSDTHTNTANHDIYTWDINLTIGSDTIAEGVIGGTDQLFIKDLGDNTVGDADIAATADGNNLVLTTFVNGDITITNYFTTNTMSVVVDANGNGINDDAVVVITSGDPDANI